jgi:hypothetical protein
LLALATLVSVLAFVFGAVPLWSIVDYITGMEYR